MTAQQARDPPAGTVALSGAGAEALSGGLRAAILAAAVARPRGGSACGGHRDRDVLTGTFALAAVTTGSSAWM